MFKKILLATDGSPLSDKAIRSTLQLAKEQGSKIVGVCVATISPYFPLYGMEAISGEFVDAITNEAGENVGKISALAASLGVNAEVHVLEGSSASEEIIQAAEKYHCDVIAMASHGKSGPDKLMLGSEAHKVLVHSKLPVLVFK
ncbi:universal stress protein [Herminiimonas fonticola]|uniref:Nucleotide-binding universal stress UspA family protein n=1 Tax=Herminiimonas fonticola TaxID=303380 RepID=A0A4R6G136_9BURK|nr:universal stress protein [Herminiimonas fonticola]RBA23633.1 Universal stress protein UspA and related nucleotide-binding protein [Herminiimonas fonticola]TDN88039.1 nucleotide-binding universal stress UspA family protein [Herminiimonas fonticola]